MKNYVGNIPENCNNCIFKQNRSQHLDLEDYCSRCKKELSKIIMDEDYPLRKIKGVKIDERKGK